MRITPFTFESLTTEESTTPTAVLADGTSAMLDEELMEAALPTPVFNEEELEQAKSGAHDEGFLAGKKEGIREAEKDQQEKLDELNHVTTKIEQQLQQMQQSYARTLTRQQSDISKLVMACAQRLAGEALRNDPVSDISEMIENCLAGLFDAPQVSIKVHPDLMPALEARLPKNVALQGDENMNLHDCQIDWQHGQVTRNSERIWRELDDMIQRHFATPTGKEESITSNSVEATPPSSPTATITTDETPITPEETSAPNAENQMTNQGENHE